MYSTDGGMEEELDTLHIKKGKFECILTPADAELHTYTIVYPNFATLEFQAARGMEINIKGDALSLNQVKVELKPERKDLTEENAPTAKGRRKIPQLKVGQKMPKNKHLTLAKDKYMLVGFMANWKYGSGQLIYHTRRALQEHPDSLAAFTCLLDLQDGHEKLSAEDEKSFGGRWTYYCDFKGLEGDLPTQYGICNLPCYVLLDPRGTILAIGSEYNRDIKAAMEKVP